MHAGADLNVTDTTVLNGHAERLADPAPQRRIEALAAEHAKRRLAQEPRSAKG